MRGFFARLRALLGRQSAESELDDEMRYHLEKESERLIAAGWDAGAARLEAKRLFGNAPLYKEEVRDAWGARWLDEIVQDVRVSLRGFRRAPGFVATVVATISLGLALNTTAFTIFDTYVLKPLPIKDPATLFDTFWHDRNGRIESRIGWKEYQRIVESPVVKETFAYNIAMVRSGEQPLIGLLFSGNAFQVLGARPQLGRLFGPADAEPPDGWPVVVLSHAAWVSKFGADSNVIGRKILINGMPLTVLGVATPDFTGIGAVPPDFWAPITMLGKLRNAVSLFDPSNPPDIRAVVRVKPGVSTREARAALGTWGAGATLDRPDSLRWNDVDLQTVGNPLPWTLETIALFVPAGIAFALVLLIGCVNVANVMLARGIARQREIGVRLALGAGRARLIRQLFTESVLLALPAAALGLYLSRITLGAGIRVILGTVPPDIGAMLRFMPMEPNLRVFGFILLAALASAIVFGLAPALQATRPNLVQASRGDFDTDFGSGRARNLLIVSEVAACSLLLIVTGILLRGAQSATSIDPVIRTHDMVQLSIDDSDRVATVRRLRGIPGVRAVAATAPMVLDAIYPTIALKHPNSAAVSRVYMSYVDSAYFPTVDVKIDRGRNFTSQEDSDTAAVVIVSEAAARLFWPGGNPIGQMLEAAKAAPDGSRLTKLRLARVIGVAQNAPPGWIGIDRRNPAIYYPASAESDGMKLLVRVDDANALKHRIDRVLTDGNPRAIYQINTLDDYLLIQTWPFKAFSWGASFIGIIALILTVIGIYGVLSYVVAQRTKEIGIRMALGGGFDSVVGLIMRQVGKRALIGLAIGFLLAAGVSRIFSSVLVVVDSFDPIGYAIGIGVVAIGALLAALAPARRAARVNPAIALRSE